MRKLFLSPAILLGVLVVFQSCSKKSVSESVAPVASNVINATISPNGSYLLPINNTGTVSISKQALHFLISQTETDSKNGKIVYKYIPVADYTGSDEVILSNTKTALSNAGGCPNSSGGSASVTTSTSYTTIKLNIAN